MKRTLIFVAVFASILLVAIAIASPTLTYHVNKSNPSCSDSLTPEQANSPQNSYCTINAALQDIQIGYRLIISPDTYCEKIDMNLYGISGTPTNYIVIGGEDENSKPILDGNCAGYGNNIQARGEDYIKFTNIIANDAIVDGIGSAADTTNTSDCSLGLIFENIEINSAGTTGTAGDGDASSHHGNCQAEHFNIVSTGSAKSAITDVDNTTTSYTNIYADGIYKNSTLAGVFFSGGLHNVTNATILRHSYGLKTTSNGTNTFNDITISDSKYFQIWIAGGDTTINNLLIQNTNPSSYSIYLQSAQQFKVVNGQIDGKVCVLPGQIATLVNVNYTLSTQQTESCAGTIIRKWKYNALVESMGEQPLQDAQVEVFNAQGEKIYDLTTNAEGKTPEVNLTEYVYQNGIRNTQSSYSVKTTYNQLTETKEFNINSNIINDAFMLDIPPMPQQETCVPRGKTILCQNPPIIVESHA